MLTPDRVGRVALVDVFDVDAESGDAFVEVWSRLAAVMQRHTGFVSLMVLQAVSARARFQVVALSTWESLDAVQVSASQFDFVEAARRAADELGIIAHPGVYRTVLAVSGNPAHQAI